MNDCDEEQHRAPPTTSRPFRCSLLVHRIRLHWSRSLDLFQVLHQKIMYTRLRRRSTSQKEREREFLASLRSDYEVPRRWNAWKRIAFHLRIEHYGDSHRREDISPLSSLIHHEISDICMSNRDIGSHRFPTFESLLANPNRSECFLKHVDCLAFTSWMLTPKLLPSSTLGIINWIHNLIIAIWRERFRCQQEKETSISRSNLTLSRKWKIYGLSFSSKTVINGFDGTTPLKT